MSEIIYRLRLSMEFMPGKYDGIPLGCIPSPEDKRDYQYQKLLSALQAGEAVPETIDFRPNLPPAFNQGTRGSCVSAASVWTPKAYQEISQGDFPASGLSAAFLYSMCKKLDDMPNEEGTYPRIAMQVLQKIGVCPEEWMPYWMLSNLPTPQVPEVPNTALERAEKFKIKTYAQICAPADADRSSTLNTMRQALKREGPFLLALLVCENFSPDADGRLPLPEGRVLGGHAVGIVGDLPSEGALIMRNSWGTAWGQDGYALLPYEWLTRRYDFGWYVFEAWTATDIVVPKAARTIEVSPGARHIVVDGQKVLIDQPAFLSPAGRLMLPVRGLAGNMGYLVQWDGQKATLTKN